ncbi:glycosyltransferase family 4 protein [Reichenbachiella ulvae]|uniref:Glycosyltransferase family 4 protein n=1 Tax=Reichenbachiella ulvae TaxID=2980104 RepID=A0ABT3CZI5_9BACT|nr:glycosyltransferase family 4 protein [Reichenbachiella ulvae]MCV9388618.1 glycosyltransferase family 4 protein [Reichenbachiella ulvae]
MRVVICINTSWNIFNFRSGLIKGLLAKGYQVIAVAPQDEYSDSLVQMGCEFRPVQMHQTGSNPFRDFHLFLDLRRIYADVKPDIIYQYTVKPNIYGSLAARSLGIPVVNNVSGLGTVFLNRGLTSRIAKLLYKLAFQKADLVFFQNKDDKADFLTQIKLPHLRTDLLPGSGIDLQSFQSKSEISNKPFRFLMIARLILDKGVEEYLLAARNLKREYPEVVFQLLGQLDEKHARGVAKKYLQEFIDDDTIEYLGTSDSVKQLIDESTCVVLPSYREGTPKTLLEAAAMSRPIVTTDVPGCREVVEDGRNGYLCRVMDWRDLARKMQKMIELPPEELMKLGKNGRQYVASKFDEQLIINKYLEVTANILE